MITASNVRIILRPAPHFPKTVENEREGEKRNRSAFFFFGNSRSDETRHGLQGWDFPFGLTCRKKIQRIIQQCLGFLSFNLIFWKCTQMVVTIIKGKDGLFGLEGRERSERRVGTMSHNNYQGFRVMRCQGDDASRVKWEWLLYYMNIRHHTMGHHLLFLVCFRVIMYSKEGNEIEHNISWSETLIFKKY